MSYFLEFRRDIAAFLIALRRSVDEPFARRVRLESYDINEYMKIMLMIEEARIRFDSHFYSSDRRNVDKIRESKYDLIKFIDEFIVAASSYPDIFRLPFRGFIARRPRINIQEEMQSIFYNELDVVDAIAIFRDVISRSEINNYVDKIISLNDFVETVPLQQVAPAKFDIVANKIILADGAPKTLKDDRNNISAAFDHIRNAGRNLIASLEGSNCDRRLIDSVKDLQDQIEKNGNIVKIGLKNLDCGVMSSQFEEELPDALNAMFNAHSISVSMYVAQFPEWEQFTQRAAAIEFTDKEIAEIDNAAAELILSLESQTELADPEVPRTLKYIRELMNRPGKTLKRAAFAVMRTIENLISSILRYSASLIKKTSERLLEGVSESVSNMVVGILAIAMIGSTGIGEAALHAGVPWVKKATEVVQSQIILMKQGRV